VFAGYVRVTLMDSIRMSVDRELSSSNRSASAALAFNAPESARLPAALSTQPNRTPPRSEAFRKGANVHNFFATVDYAHIPECYWKPPQPPAEHIFADTERLGECHNGCVRQVTAQEAGQWGQQAEERPGAIPPAGRVGGVTGPAFLPWFWSHLV